MSHYLTFYPALSTVLRHLEASIQAEQVFCSIVTEMEQLPPFKDQPDLKIVHRENYETSYHRNTAAGNLHRLLTHGNSSEARLILLTVECLMEARAHEKRAEAALARMNVDGEEEQLWLDAANKWHRRRRRQLKYASKTLYETIGPDMWKKGAELAE